ncbi:hypothetical protein BH23CHL9_BH23CHL9_01570 [soil metagenome]
MRGTRRGKRALLRRPGFPAGVGGHAAVLLASALAGIARSVLADLEAGRLASHSVAALTQAAETVGVDAELTFNHYGGRGSIDLFAWHSATRTLVVIEIKTVIVDVRDLLSNVDRKVRIGRSLAVERGWTPRAVLPVLLVAEGSTARRRIAEHAALFGRFSPRGRSAMAWLRQPDVATALSGVL